MELGKFLILLLMGCLVILTTSFVDAEQQSQSYSKIYMNPLYRQSMDQDINYTYTLTVDTPDGIDFVSNAMLTMQIWMNPTINFYVWVDGQVCNTPTFQVHTTYANAGEGTIFFDCSNIITGEGTYEVTMQTDDDTGASTFWADITYSNSPRPKMTFGATDYFTSEPDQLIFVQLISQNEVGSPIDNAVCYADVYASNALTQIITNSPMVHTSDGIYHLHVNLIETGVHIVSVECFYEYNSFERNVSSTLTTFGNYERLEGTVNYNFFSTTNGGDDYTNQTSVVNTMSGDVELRLDWDNKFAMLNTTDSFENDDVVRMYSHDLDDIGNTIYLHNLAETIVYGSYVISNDVAFTWKNVTLANTGSGVDTIYISDLNQGGAHDIDFAFIEITDPTGGGWFGDPDTSNTLSDLNTQDGNYWQIVEDSADKLEVEFTFSNLTGEFNDSANLLINARWSEPTENLNISIYNVSSSSWVLLPNQITYAPTSLDFNNEIPGNLLDYLSGSNELKVKIEHTLINTNYGFLEIDKLIGEAFAGEGVFISDVKGGGEIHIINATTLAGNFWDYPDRQLTSLNFDTTDEQAIWEYNPRTLTNFTVVANSTFNISGIADEIWSYNGTVEPTLLSQFATGVWNFVNKTLTYFDYEKQGDYTWNTTGRYTHGIIIP